MPLEGLLHAPTLNTMSVSSSSDVVKINAGFLDINFYLFTLVTGILDFGLLATDGQVLRLMREGNFAHHAISVWVNSLIDYVWETANRHSWVIRTARQVLIGGVDG